MTKGSGKKSETPIGNHFACAFQRNRTKANDCFRAIWAARLTAWCWPGAAVPNVRRKQTMENIGQIGEGLLYGASPHRQSSARSSTCGDHPVGPSLHALR